MAAKKTAKKTTAKKAIAKKAIAKKAIAKKAPAKKIARKAPAKKAPAKKVAARKAPAKKVARKAPAKRAAAPQGMPGVPAGHHSVTPNLVFKDAAAAIAWYGKVYGAKEISRMVGPDGKSTWHAEIQIGDSLLYLVDESPMGGGVAPSGPRTTTASFQIFVPDADALIKVATDAGATAIMPASDMFWGDRMGVVSDPFGHLWMISTRVRHLSQAEMAAAGEAFVKQMAASAGKPPTEECAAPEK
jgi:uncharacterized glyoxalase superfamily protein PhnB